MADSNGCRPPPAKRVKLEEIAKFINEGEKPGAAVGSQTEKPKCSAQTADGDSFCGPSTSHIILKPAATSFEIARDFLTKKLKVIEETMIRSEIPKPIFFQRRRKLSYKNILAQLSESFGVEDNLEENSAKRRKLDLKVVLGPTTRSLKRRVQNLENSFEASGSNASKRPRLEDTTFTITKHVEIDNCRLPPLVADENIPSCSENAMNNGKVVPESVDTAFDYAMIRYALTGTRLLFIEKPQIWKQFKTENLKLFPKLNNLSVMNIFNIFDTQILPEVYTYKLSESECRVLNLCNLNPNYRRVGNGYVKTGFKTPFC